MAVMLYPVQDVRIRFCDAPILPIASLSIGCIGLALSYKIVFFSGHRIPIKNTKKTGLFPLLGLLLGGYNCKGSRTRF